MSERETVGGLVATADGRRCGAGGGGGGILDLKIVFVNWYTELVIRWSGVAP